MARISVSGPSITLDEAMVDEKDGGIMRTDNRHNHAVDTDEITDKEQQDVIHSGSSDNEKPTKVFQEGGYGW